MSIYFSDLYSHHKILGFEQKVKQLRIMRFSENIFALKKYYFLFLGNFCPLAQKKELSLLQFVIFPKKIH